MKFQLNLRVLRTVIICIVILLTLLIGIILLNRWENTQIVFQDSEDTGSSDNNGLTYYQGKWYTPRDDLETVLIMGLDKFEMQSEETYINDEQADFLLLLVLDEETQTGKAIHLNRDTMTQITILGARGKEAGTFTGQLALAHTYGSGGTDSCRNTVKAVSNLLYGTPIDHYVSLTMSGVAVLNNLVGGVTLEVLDDFSGIDDSLVQGQTVTLYGQQALTYVRTRVGLADSTNLHRMERQRQYLAALQKQANRCMEQDDDFMLSALLELNEYLVSDCTAQQLSTLAEQYSSYEFGDFLTIDGEAVQGEKYIEYYVDELALQTMVIDLFYTQVDV